MPLRAHRWRRTYWPGVQFNRRCTTIGRCWSLKLYTPARYYGVVRAGCRLRRLQPSRFCKDSNERAEEIEVGSALCEVPLYELHCPVSSCRYFLRMCGPGAINDDGDAKVKSATYSTMIRPALEYYSPVRDPRKRNDIQLLEKVRRLEREQQLHGQRTMRH